MSGNRTLVAYFILVTALCTAMVVGARMAGEQSMYLVQLYMLTPAIAAIVTRLFFHPQHFRDAGLRLRPLRNFLRFWLYSLGIVVLYFAGYTLFGAVRWDLSGSAYLALLDQMFRQTGGSINNLPQGMTPEMMLALYAVGGLTVFNILPGIITGFGEEFGWRGLLFPALGRYGLGVALGVGGLIWFAWHVPITLMVPSTAPAIYDTAYVVNLVVTAAGSICTFTYLAFVYVKSGSIWVAAVAHIAMNNASRSFAYYVVVQDQFTANLVTVLVMALVVGFLYWRGEFKVFAPFLERQTRLAHGVA